MKKSNALTKILNHSYEAERNLRHFCSVTSDQLCTLLAVTCGELDYASSHSNPSQHEKSLKVAKNAAERATFLARNLRYFAVHTRLDGKNTDLSQLVLDAIDLVESEFEKKKIEFSVLVESGLYGTADPGALLQSVVNLLWFSYHSMPKGGKLAVSLQKNGTRLEITVSDTGNGLSEEQMERVFEPYFLSYGPSHENRGLGLAVSKIIVEAHGGEILVRSKLGQGTNFILQLPFDAKLPKPVPHSEKRRFRRVPVALPAEINLAGDSLQCTVTTLSTGGCFVSLHQKDLKKVPSKNDHSLSLKIYYHEDHCIEVTHARIASTVTSGLQLGMGIEFVETDLKTERLLQALVRNRIS